MSDSIIQLKHVNFWYDKGKSNEYQALKDVSVDIERGEYVAFFGASGSGKTTLLYLLAGIEQGQTGEGEILINGRNIASLSKRELAIYRQVGVGMVFQQFNLIPSLTVAQNVMLPMSFLGSTQDRAKKEALTLLDRLGIAYLADRFPTELSGGQQQRVAIARALANNPPIIVADEPLGNLDSSNAQAALELLKDLNEKDGRTIIMVTHEAWSLRDAKRIFYLKDGVVTESAPGRSKQETLSKLMYGQLAPELNPNQLTARTLTELLLRGYSAPELKRFEFFLNQRLAEKIDADVFRMVLDRSWKDGGLGLWRQKAEKVGGWIEELISEERNVEDIYRRLEANPESAIQDDIEKLKSWLLEGYEGKITGLQNAQLVEVIYERIRGIITPEIFLKTLNLPRRESGMGFSIHTAQRIGEKLELALKQGHPQVGAAA